MNILYETYTVWTNNEPAAVYSFCVGGEWDADTLFLDEALKKYPKDKYTWEEAFLEDDL